MRQKLTQTPKTATNAAKFMALPVFQLILRILDNVSRLDTLKEHLPTVVRVFLSPWANIIIFVVAFVWLAWSIRQPLEPPRIVLLHTSGRERRRIPWRTLLVWCGSTGAVAVILSFSLWLWDQRTETPAVVSQRAPMISESTQKSLGIPAPPEESLNPLAEARSNPKAPEPSPKQKTRAAEKLQHPSPLKSSESQPAPLPVKRISYTQEPASSERDDAPYAVRVVIQTTVLIQPTSLAVECNAPVVGATYYMVGSPGLRNTGDGYLDGEKRIFWVVVGEPAFKPESPLIMLLMAKQPIKVLGISQGPPSPF